MNILCHRFSLLGLEVNYVIKVRFILRKCAVTRQTYSEIAEGACRLRFADGREVGSEVRLIKDSHSNWSRFLGRDRAFVEQQITRFLQST